MSPWHVLRPLVLENHCSCADGRVDDEQLICSHLQGWNLNLWLLHVVMSQDSHTKLLSLSPGSIADSLLAGGDLRYWVLTLVHIASVFSMLTLL